MSPFQRLARLRAAALGLAFALAGSAATAAIVTLSGPSFDLRYDTALLGDYGTPTLVGHSVFFTTGSVTAQRFSTGRTATTTLLQGLVITMRDGSVLDRLTVSVLGDYFLDGAGASVSVGGLLSVDDASVPGSSRSEAALAVDDATPLTLQGVNSDWRASAVLDAGSPVLGGGGNVFASGTRAIGVSLGTEIVASLGAGSGFREAFIEQKFAGLELIVGARAVPSPGSAPLVLAALLPMAWALRRR